jgi:hypothetical protein
MTRRRTVMISSTARDLPKHREQVRLACERAGFEPREMMENLTAENRNAVETSLRMVEEAAAAKVARHSGGDNSRTRELRCRIILSSIWSIGWTIDETLLIKSIKRGILPISKALHWAEYQPPHSRAKIVIGILPFLPEADRSGLLMETAAAIRNSYDDHTSCYAATILADALPKHERNELLGWALARAESLEDPFTALDSL